MPDGVYQRENTEGTLDNIYVIDLESEDVTFGVQDGKLNTQKEEFIKGILYGRDAMNDEIRANFESRGIRLYPKGICGRISIREGIVERLGIYYQQETQGKTPESIESVPDADKDLKRVVTYTKNEN